MTLNTHRRGPVRVLDAPDGHAVIIEGPGDLRLHLGDAEIGDATGLGVIVHLHRRATRADRRLLLVDASDRTTRLLRGCRLERLIVPRHPALTVAPLTA